MRRFIAAAVFLIPLATASAQLHPDAWSTGTPVKIPTGGVKIDGMFFKAAGDGAHPVMIYFHGMPGFSGDLDLPLPVSRAGWNVLTLHYRGSWGSPGDYSYAHQIEDAKAAIAFVRDPVNAGTLGIDASHIVITGHSTGGMIAAITAVDTPRLDAVILISASDDAQEAVNQHKAQATREAPAKSTPCSAPLAGCTNEGLDRESLEHASSWSFAALAPRLKNIRILMITSNDSYKAENDELQRAIAANSGVTIPRVRLNTGHAYADQRAALANAVTRWLRGLYVVR